MIKIQILILSLSIICCLTSCGEDELSEENNMSPTIDLTGNWTGENYECDFIFFDEQISIVHDLGTGSVIATKIDGDSCVRAGDITFTGIYDGKASAFRVQFRWGTPDDPNSGWGAGGTMDVESPDLMVVRHDKKFRFLR